MRRVVALFLPTFPTDQIRRRNPRNLPMVMAMQEGNRRVLTSVDDAARKLKRTYRGAREAAARFAAPAFFR
jgi:protein ImuB